MSSELVLRRSVGATRTDARVDPSGFIKTIKADAMWQAAIARVKEVGLPLDPNPDPNGDLSPILDKAAVWTYIDNLYDDAQSDLQAGGSSFP